MKKLVFISSLLIVVALTTSCSKDNGPAPGNEQQSFDVVFNLGQIKAGYSTTTPIQTTQLASVLSSANADKASYVNKGDIQNAQSYITVSGLQAGVTLSSVKINLMNGTDSSTAKADFTYSLNLGAVGSDGSIQDSTSGCVAFLSNVATYMATKKSANLQVILTAGTQDVSNLTVTIHTTAIYSW